MSFDKAFSLVAEQFPFSDYVDELVYHEMKMVTTQLGRIVGQPHGKKLLDVGCGPMDKTAIFQALGYKCSAVDDLSDPWHLLGENRSLIHAFAKEMGIDFFQQNCGNYSVPFEKNAFDVVTCSAVIEHLHASPRGILNWIGEYIKPGGLVVVTMPNSVNLRKRISVLFGRTNYNPIEELYLSLGEYRGHVREYTLLETKNILEWSGFEVLYANTFEHIAQKRLKFFSKRLYMLLGIMVPGFQSGLMVIARKPLEWKSQEANENAYFSVYPPPIRKASFYNRK